MEYRPRVIDAEIAGLMTGVAALAIEGPKGVGKTVTASRFARDIIRLDDPATREVFTADVDRLSRSREPLLIDEWQRVPSSWDRVRRAVDERREPGRFLLTGSAAPVEVPLHSGAGRIVSIRMRPMALSERGLTEPTVSLAEMLRGQRPQVQSDSSVTLADYVEAITSSGFPGLQGLAGRTLRAELDGYLTRISQRDLLEFGQRLRRPATLVRWMRAYAGATSTTASYESIRDAATGGENDKPARSTTIPFRDALESLWIVDPVPAWVPGGRSVARLGAAPKHQLADPALAARLLQVTSDVLLSGDAAAPRTAGSATVLGALFESLATLSVRVYAQAAEASVGHLRTRAGEHEVDLMVEASDGRIVAFEVKLSPVVDNNDVKHLRWLESQLGDHLADAAVLTTGPYSYRRADGIAVIPLAMLGP